MKEKTKNIISNFEIKCLSIVKFISLFTAYCILFTNYSFSQTATATVKEKEYLIGDWIPVDLFVSASSNNKVAFPNLKDSISETIEVANFTPIDTVKKGGENQYHQLVNLIVFDTGQIQLPQFQFLVNNNGTVDSITSEAILVHVAGVKIDTSKDIIPIKEPLKIPYTFKEILPFAIVFIVFAIFVGLLVWFIIKRKKKPVPIDEKYLLAPHVWAFKELEKLEKEKVWQQNIKEYYSRLTDVARTYIELRYKLPAMEQTTEELMQSMHKGIVKQAFKKELNEVLTLSDFVKFAKAQPDFIENENSMKIVKNFITKTKQLEEEKKPINN